MEPDMTVAARAEIEEVAAIAAIAAIAETASVKQRLRPLVDRVLVRVLPPQDEMKNGLYVPDSAKEKPQEGIVVAVGNGAVKNGERIAVDVQVGQRVVFGKFSGNEVFAMGETLLLLREDELMGVYEN